MKIELDQKNYVKLIPETGARIIELVLDGHTVIKANQPYDDNGSGNFLMFPWISKAPQNPYQPELKNQYHGFSINTPRKVEIQKVENGLIKITSRAMSEHIDRHNFEEVFILKKGVFVISFTVLNNEKDKLPYCFGYHPYLQIDSQHLDNIEFHTDIHTLLEFDQNTLPIYPFKERQVKISSDQNYNNLFRGGSYFEMKSSKQVHLRIESDLPYWQIYNPPSRKTIAVQPASFCGNLYNIYKQDPHIQLAKSGIISLKVWNT